MNPLRETLKTYLYNPCLKELDDHCQQSAILTGFMVAGIRDSADLWQEAQDAYGMGADGLMELLSEYAQGANTMWRALSDSQTWGRLVDQRQASVETVFMWSVIEPFGEELARKIRDTRNFTYGMGIDLLIGRIVDWLLGTERANPSEKDRWYLELANRTEGFYSEAETLQEAIADCMDYYGLVSDSGIRKIERL